MSLFNTCCVPGCPNSDVGASHEEFGDFVCGQHYAAGAPALRERLRVTQKRLAALRAKWDDDRYFGEILARGRYLKFCALLEWAQENVDSAWSRLMLDILSAEGRVVAPKPQLVRVAS